MTMTKNIMKVMLGATALTAFSAVSALAGGTDAGTTVKNTFTLDYSVSGTAQPTISTCKTGDTGCTTETSTNFAVDRVIDLAVDSTTDTDVTPGETDQILVFTLTNEGNDTQKYDLAAFDTNTSSPTADFTPYEIWIEDSPGAGTFTQFTGSNYPSLDKDESITVQIRADIPTDAVDGDAEEIALVAYTLDPVSETAVTEDTDGNNADLTIVENVFADDETAGEWSAEDSTSASDARESARAVYNVLSAVVTANKTVTIFSEDGTGCSTIPGTATGGYSIPGACVEYVIEVDNEGSQAASSINLADVLNDNLTFVAATTSGFTGGSFSPALPSSGTDCTGGACNISFAGGTLASGSSGSPTTGTLTIRALVQ